jgi:predicted metal-dependent phosphotriesterase family hydrolase
MSSVMGVKGLLSDSELGFTLPHEHLFTDLSCYWNGDPQGHFDQKIELTMRQEVLQSPWKFRDNTILDDLSGAVDEAAAFVSAGGKTINKRLWLIWFRSFMVNLSKALRIPASIREF